MRAFGLRLLLALGANAVAFIICAALLDGFDIGGADLVWAVVIFSLVNWLVPIIALTALRRRSAASLGLILLLANAATLLITDWLSDGIDISGAGTLIIATIIIWIVNLAIDFIPGPWRRQRLARKA
ncbi:MAG: phage holin family protein [Thermoleophilia bacterium]|nr:phage holin family protein [Thermoleophilia bacterium]MDH4340075.1 phage holin family protein [Thermoleophilia bacterium]MDH5280156.1 phage holin family protein [Thermoleophilia bacterium]